MQHGAWRADGKGGCKVKCESDAYFGLGDECFETCPLLAPPRAVWTHDENNECQLGCNSPDQKVWADGCFQDCPQPKDASQYYFHDENGFCKLACNGNRLPYGGECVYRAGEPCGIGNDGPQAYVADGMGGCDIRCVQGYTKSADGRCLQVCESGLLPDGAKYVHSENGECEIQCKKSDNVFANGECVPLLGSSCKDMGGTGVATADGLGGCDIRCNKGHVLTMED